jgi:MFS family permease
MGIFQSAGSLGRIGGPMLGGLLFAMNISAPTTTAAIGALIGFLIVLSTASTKKVIEK